ncbi:phage protein NinX family protein [Cronobacter malonaticus]
MDYAHLSDDEINNMVGRVVSQRFRTDYCNNPADAWPIIFSNRIGVVPGIASDKWAAHYCNWDIAIADTNPLRAAMIVFLMMQESQHA